MHITHALGHSLPGRRRHAVAALVAAFCITFAFAIGGTAPASAAGPDPIRPGDPVGVTYPTWGWGGTKVCVTNDEGEHGMAKVQPLSNPGQNDEIYVPAYDKKCIDRWWFGSPIQVTNISPDALGTFPMLTVETF